MTPTKQCTKCNTSVSIELFGDNGKGECFKACDICREKSRASNAREREKKRQPEEDDTETLNKDTRLTVMNRNLFNRNILAHIFELAPRFQVHFQKPEEAELAMTLHFNDRLGMHIKYGIPWMVLKASLLKQSPFVLPSIDSITDDTIADEMNIGVFLEKIRTLAPDEDIKIEKLIMSAGITINFIDRHSRMALRIGDRWKNIYFHARD